MCVCACVGVLCLGVDTRIREVRPCGAISDTAIDEHISRAQTVGINNQRKKKTHWREHYLRTSLPIYMREKKRFVGPRSEIAERLQIWKCIWKCVALLGSEFLFYGSIYGSMLPYWEASFLLWKYIWKYVWECVALLGSEFSFYGSIYGSVLPYWEASFLLWKYIWECCLIGKRISIYGSEFPFIKASFHFWKRFSIFGSEFPFLEASP